MGPKLCGTTRSMNVCNSMESGKEIKVEGLTDEEAWSLFKDKVGAEDIIMLAEIQPIAKQVAEECGRSLLAHDHRWPCFEESKTTASRRNALRQLKTSRADRYMDYEILVDELIEYWMAEGLIDEEGSIQTGKDRGHAYLKELKDACMIVSVGNDDKFVRMHDLIRDLAINITREPPLFMVKAGLQLEESPKEEEWVESLERVSLMSNGVKAFKGEPNCPRLTNFLLKENGAVTFSDTFFKHMHNLQVLDLSGTRIKSLPSSLSDLMNLHALILTNCSKLKCLPSLAKLHKLRQLKLGGLRSLN
ncbi:probable disease resistance protein At1g15890 [Dioscorea cayenensis subsp. rotundata]|uniref:Probable disease resistance protein At1g15890 n=1 Tax=Dioscorea cayennensis subsp. rotundata TaxID=55577 RepID=A0AB40C569_DIOCR|nr:probable disease resistance protein At1g15890 [Dioscorea cayenensis subsp. rotundata]